MPLFIQIAGTPTITGQGEGSASGTYALQVTNFRVEHERFPKASPLPGGDPLLIDLGQRIVRLILTGTASEAGTNNTDGAIRVADRDELEIMGRTWSNNVTLTDSTMTPARTYTGKIQKVQLERKTVLTVYDFILIIVGFMNP